jgi:acetamidase/formamidase
MRTTTWGRRAWPPTILAVVSDFHVVEFRPTPDQYAWTFGGVAPVHHVDPGTVLEVWTEDCFAGRVRSERDLVSEVCEFPFLNPQTGPFHVNGAEPGDTLAVHLVSVEPARDWAASTTVPLFGALTATHTTAMLHEPLPEVVWIWRLDREARTCRFEARRGSWSVELPMDPMHGTLGVAPANLEVRSALVPDAFGGNMDTPELRAGVTCYLGVNVPGALVSLGDGHARQGEGETCGVAVEAAMDSVIIVDLIKGRPCAWPRIESDTHIMSTGSARPLEDAFRIAQADMVGWVSSDYGLDVLDAYQLISQAVEAPLANVVDTNYTSVAKMPKRWLPAADAYGGMHRSLTARADAYRSGRRPQAARG